MKRLLLFTGVTILAVQAVFLGLRVTGSRAGVDEAWLAEQAYFQSHDGYVHSELFRGYCHNEDRIMLQHRLFILMAAGLIKIAGFHLIGLRLIALTSAAVLMLLFRRYCLRYLELDSPTVLAASGILMLMPLFFRYTVIFRPEMLYTAFGFGSFLCLAGEDSHRLRRALAGFLAGLSLVTHPNGAIFVIAGIALLLWERRFICSAVFLAGAAVVMLPYVIELSGNIPLLREQLSGELSAGKTTFTILTPFSNLLNEHKSLFRKPETIFTSILILTSLLATPRQAFRRFSPLYRYSAVLLVSLGLLTCCKTVTYTVPLLPFGAAIFAVALSEFSRLHIEHRYRRAKRSGFAFAALLLLLYGLYFSAHSISGGGCYIERENALAGDLIPEGETCLAPMNFIFGQIDRLRISGLYLARVLCENREMSIEYLLDYAEQRRIGYIVLDDYWIEHTTGCEEFLNQDQSTVDVIDTGELLVLKIVNREP
jgi:hypothetical protein